MKRHLNRRLSRRVVRQVLVEALEARVLLSSSTATLSVNTEQTVPAPVTAVISPGGTLTGGTFTSGSPSGSGNSFTGSTTVNNSSGLSGVTGTLGGYPHPTGVTVTVSPPSAGVRIQSSGTASVLAPPTLTVNISSTTITPITYTTTDGGTGTAYMQGTLTVWPQAYQITGWVGTPVLGTPFTATPTGTVELLDGSTVIASATLDGNQATFQPVLTAGTHQLFVKYMGDTIFGAETSAGVTQAVTGIPVTMQLSTSATAIPIGSQFTVSVAVTAEDGSVPNGPTVTLYSDGNAVGTATVSNGIATFTLTATSLGLYSLYASLPNGVTYTGNTSSTVDVTVNPSATVLTLGMWQDASAVTFTATAAGPNSVAAAPTGTVYFYDGGTLVGSATLGQSNSVSLQFMGGTHHFSAQYGGDGNFLAATADSTFSVLAIAPMVLTNTAIPDHHQAVGHVDVLDSSRIAGWAVDQDIPTESLVVSVYVDGVAVAYPVASMNRPGLTALYGSANHGFSLALPTLSQGLHRIDVYAQDYSRTEVLLASKTVSKVNTPIGAVDVATSTQLAGWAYADDAEAAPIQVRYSIDGGPAFVATADAARSDLQSVLGSSNHGFSINLPQLTAGNHTMAIDAYDSTTGASTRLATRTVTVGNAVGDILPIGAIDIASNARVAGWVMIPGESIPPLQVRIDIDGAPGTPTAANIARPDLAAHFGSSGNGFDVALPPLAAGNHRIDVYAIDATTNAAVLIGSRNTATAAPVAAVDILSATRIAGWAYAASAPTAPVRIRVDVDGMIGTPVLANLSRPDLAFLGATTFAFDLPLAKMAAGSHRITVSLIDPITGEAIVIGAKTVVVA